MPSPEETGDEQVVEEEQPVVDSEEEDVEESPTVSRSEYEAMQQQVIDLQSRINEAEANEEASMEPTTDEYYRKMTAGMDPETAQAWENDPQLKATKRNSEEISALKSEVGEILQMMRSANHERTMKRVDEEMTSKYPDWLGPIRAKAIEIAKRPGCTGLTNDQYYRLAKLEVKGSGKPAPSKSKKGGQSETGSTRREKPNAEGGDLIKNAADMQMAIGQGLDEFFESSK